MRDGEAWRSEAPLAYARRLFCTPLSKTVCPIPMHDQTNWTVAVGAIPHNGSPQPRRAGRKNAIACLRFPGVHP